MSASSTSGSTSGYQSAFDGYRGFKDQKVLSWRESNDLVGRIGGWQAYAREAAGGDAVPDAPAVTGASGAPAPMSPAASSPGASPASVKTPAAKPGDMPASSPSRSHGGHAMPKTP